MAFTPLHLSPLHHNLLPDPPAFRRDWQHKPQLLFPGCFLPLANGDLRRLRKLGCVLRNCTPYEGNQSPNYHIFVYTASGLSVAHYGGFQDADVQLGWDIDVLGELCLVSSRKEERGEITGAIAVNTIHIMGWTILVPLFKVLGSIAYG